MLSLKLEVQWEVSASYGTFSVTST